MGGREEVALSEEGISSKQTQQTKQTHRNSSADPRLGHPQS